MDISQLHQSSGGGDRLSKLEDRVLGHILSFLPAKEAARAAALSSRWRDVFASVHTISLEKPEGSITDDDDVPGCDSPECRARPDPNEPPPFSSAVSAALLTRNRRRGAAPLRALRVAMGEYRGGDSCTVDQWVYYAVQQAAPALDIDLRLRRVPVRARPYYFCCGQPAAADVSSPAPPWSVDDDAVSEPGDVVSYHPWRSMAADTGSLSDDDDVVLSCCYANEEVASFDYHLQAWEPAVHTMSRVLFSCAALRSLSLGSCRLDPPATVTLPSLEALLLSHVSDPGSDVQRLISGCPRLADLTLEACDAVDTLSVLDGARLRRLALRCCHNLTAVAVDASELKAFDYKGAVPDDSFLTLHGGSRRIEYCKVDICGDEVTSEEDLIKLRQLLQLFANAKHLHLESARLGLGFNKDVSMRFPSLSSLRGLELRGRLPDDDDDDMAVVGAVRTILDHTPGLETLTLVFHPEEEGRGYYTFNEEELLDAHHLSYNPHSVLAVPSFVIPCLRSRVREINLVHYQGGRAQRTLAKFLLCNAAVMEELWCAFAEGPLWTQTQLMREIKGWVVNKSANTHFS